MMLPGLGYLGSVGDGSIVRGVKKFLQDARGIASEIGCPYGATYLCVIPLIMY